MRSSRGSDGPEIAEFSSPAPRTRRGAANATQRLFQLSVRRRRLRDAARKVSTGWVRPAPRTAGRHRSLRVASPRCAATAHAPRSESVRARRTTQRIRRSFFFLGCIAIRFGRDARWLPWRCVRKKGRDKKSAAAGYSSVHGCTPARAMQFHNASKHARPCGSAESFRGSHGPPAQLQPVRPQRDEPHAMHHDATQRDAMHRMQDRLFDAPSARHLFVCLSPDGRNFRPLHAPRCNMQPAPGCTLRKSPTRARHFPV